MFMSAFVTQIYHDLFSLVEKGSEIADGIRKAKLYVFLSVFAGSNVS